MAVTAQNRYRIMITISAFATVLFFTQYQYSQLINVNICATDVNISTTNFKTPTRNTHQMPAFKKVILPESEKRYITYQNVCIEQFKSEKRFVVYSTKEIKYDIKFIPEILIQDPHKFKKTSVMSTENATLVFATIYTNNFFHFMENLMIPVFEALAQKGLISNQSSKIKLYIYRIEVNKSKKGFARWYSGAKGPLRISGFMKTIFPQLSIGLKVDHISSIPKGMCYSEMIFQRNFTNDIFGDFLPKVVQNARRNELAKFLLWKYQIDKQSCSNNKHVIHTNVTTKRYPKLTIIQRKSKERRILNLDELLAAGKSHGIEMNVVKLEELDIRNQIITMFCAEVVLGVSGAGLWWATFLPDTATLIEMSWPFDGKGLPHFYCNIFEVSPFKTIRYVPKLHDIIPVNKNPTLDKMKNNHTEYGNLLTKMIIDGKIFFRNVNVRLDVGDIIKLLKTL